MLTRLWYVDTVESPAVPPTDMTPKIKENWRQTSSVSSQNVPYEDDALAQVVVHRSALVPTGNVGNSKHASTSLVEELPDVYTSVVVFNCWRVNKPETTKITETRVYATGCVVQRKVSQLGGTGTFNECEDAWESRCYGRYHKWNSSRERWLKRT